MNEELARCALINFENFAKSIRLEDHVYYRIARAQLLEAFGDSTVEKELKPAGVGEG
jgi:hypothetical protein